MPVKTINAYGNISITEEAIATVAGNAVMECYGIVDMVSKKFSDYFAEVFKKQPFTRGVKVTAENNRITLDLHVVLKYGVSITAVADTLKSSVKYRVEKFTGMIVSAVNVHVVGVQL